MMPDWARDALVWNPLVHAIDWFRAGFYAAYQPHWLDRSYLIIFAILLLLTGLAVSETEPAERDGKLPWFEPEAERDQKEGRKS